MSLDERAFFIERPETRPAKYACPRCRRTNEYSVRWVRRTKKDRLPPGADERDRAKFAKLRDHLLRLDDEVVCKTCSKKFEIPSMHSLQFVDQLEGLPKDVDEEESGAEAAPGVPDAAAASGAPPARPTARGTGDPPDAPTPQPAAPAGQRELPKRFTRPTRGWRG